MKTAEKRKADGPTVKIDLTTEDAAFLTGYGPERIRQLAKGGWIKKQGPNRYEAADVVQGALAFKDDQIARLSRAGSSSKLQDARAAEIEVRVEERQGRLIAKAEEKMIETVDDILGQLKPDMLAIPARVTKDLTLRQRMDDEIEAAFGAAVERSNRRLARLEATGHVQPKSKKSKHSPKGKRHAKTSETQQKKDTDRRPSSRGAKRPAP